MPTMKKQLKKYRQIHNYGLPQSEKKHERINFILNFSLGLISVTSFWHCLTEAQLSARLLTNGSFRFIFICWLCLCMP